MMSRLFFMRGSCSPFSSFVATSIKKDTKKTPFFSKQFFLLFAEEKVKNYRWNTDIST